MFPGHSRGSRIWTPRTAIILAVPIGLLSATATAAPMVINTIQQLDEIGVDPSLPLSGDYALNANIDASGFAFTPIGAGEVPFTGMFDGNGHSIENLNITPSSNSLSLPVGLFSTVSSSGQVQNVRLTNLSLFARGGGQIYAGGLVGINEGIISNSFVSGSIDVGTSTSPFDPHQGATFAGGLVGINGNGNAAQIIGSSANVVVRATADSAGASADTGGLVGTAYLGTLIYRSSASGSVIGPTDGLWIQRAGGLVGVNSGTISQSFATTNVQGAYETGGLVGNNFGGSIIQSYSTGSVEGGSGAGGSIEVNSSYGPYVPAAGGLIGFGVGGGTVTEAYATGKVGASAGTVGVGGLVGIVGPIGPSPNLSGTFFNAAYWDTQTTGQPTSAGGVGLTTAQLQSGALPAGFDPAVWTATPGQYPKLIGVDGQQPLPNLPPIIAAPPGLGTGINLLLGSLDVHQGTDPNGPVIVLSHGFEFGADAVGTPPWLKQMATHIEARAPNATVITFTWPPGEFPNIDCPVPCVSEIGQASAATKNVGDELGDALLAYAGRPIQFIGHSLGTHVNAYAAQYLEDQGVPVRQFTILERPFGLPIENLPPSIAGSNLLEANLFETSLDDPLLNDGNTVSLIDNYYGNDPLDHTGATLGIAGHNLEITTPPYNTHSGVQEFYNLTVTPTLPIGYDNEFYQQILHDGFQCSFVVGGNGCPDPSAVPMPFTITGSVDHVGFSPTSAGNLSWETLDTTLSGNSAELVEHSPAYLWADLTIPSGTSCMSFDYLWKNIGDGDYLTVTFGNNLLFTYVGTAFPGSAFLNSNCIPVDQFDGETDQLLFALNSLGDPNADLLIQNLEFYDILPAQTVDEPSSIGNVVAGLMIFGVVEIGARKLARRRWPARVATRSKSPNAA